MAANPPTTGSIVQQWKSEKVFLMLCDPFRLRVIISLARTGAQTASNLSGGSGMKRHTYLKHLSVLCKAGFLVQKENKEDGRQPLYSLHPSILVQQTADGYLIDFGCCVLRSNQLKWLG